MKELTNEIKEKLRKRVFDLLAEECEVEVSELNDETKIVDDLDGDSLMFVELVDCIKKEYDLDIQLQTVGKYLLKNNIQTIGQVIDVCYKIYQYEDEIVNIGV